MAISFPSSPTLNQTYVVGTKTWIWNGYAWDLQVANTTPIFIQANAAFDQANTATQYGTSAGAYANAAYTQANTATQYGTGAGAYANAAYSQANTATTNAATADQKAVSAGAYANAAYSQANTATTNAATADQKAVSAGTYANASYLQANTATQYATSAGAYANSAYNQSNTATQYAQAAGTYANAAYSQANTATQYGQSSGAYANAAFTLANTKYSSSGGTISGDAVITGNLTVLGSQVYANTQTVLIKDNIITLNAAIGQSSAPTADAGLEIDRGSAANVYMIYDESNDKWKFTNDGTNYSYVGAESGATYANAAYAQANTATQYGQSSGTYANAAYLQANTATQYAQSAGTYANAAYVAANTADQKAVSAGAYANAAYVQANTATQYGQSAGAYANASFAVANTANVNAISAGTYANAAYVVANTAAAVNNTQNTNITSAATYANAAYVVANSAVANAASASAYANAAYSQANTATTNAATADQKAVSAGAYANAAYVQANTANVNAISAGTYANAAYAHANASFVQANSAYNHANAAYNQANTDYTTISATAGVYGNAAFVPVTTLTANGRVSSITSTAISIDTAAIGSGTLSVARGGTGVTTSTGTGAVVLGTAPTITLPTINNIRQGYSTTVTAAGTTILTVNSNRVQFFTGTTTQVLSLPAPQTMTLGMEFLIVNNSTGNIEVRAANSATVAIVLPGTAVSCISIDLTAGNGAAGWNAEFVGFSTITGTGAVVLNTSPTLSNVSVTGSIVTSGNVTANSVIANNSIYSPVVYSPAAASKLELSDIGLVGITVAGQTFQFGASGIESNQGIFGGSYGGNRLSLNNETNLISNRYDTVKIQTGTDGTTVNDFIFANNTFSTPGKINVASRVDFTGAGYAQPSFTTRSAGQKITLFPAISGSLVDYSIGIDGGVLWTTVPAATTDYSFKWYGGESQIASLSGTGLFTTVSANIIATTVSTSNTTGALKVAGGVGVKGNVSTDGVIFADGTRQTTAASGGASIGDVLALSIALG